MNARSSEQKIPLNDTNHYTELLENAINTYQFYPINTYDDIKEQLPYIREIRARHNYHNGQRKLLLSEVEFLTMYHKKAKYFIYAGSAPGWKNFYLSLLFRNTILILVDPNPFKIFMTSESWHNIIPDIKYVKYLDIKKPESWVPTIKSSEHETKIFLINDYFTNDTARYLNKLGPSLFNSDIRTNSDEDDYPNNLEIIWNSAQQLNWVSILKPAAYMLKFRVPYEMKEKIFPEKYQINDFAYSKEKLGIDFIGQHNKLNDKFKYLGGTIYMQAFAGAKSTETRLICEYKEPIKFVEYDASVYEKKCFYFNMIHRAYAYCYNPNSNKQMGFDHCQDCARENFIWENYEKTLRNRYRIESLVNGISTYSKRSLFESNSPEYPIHGYMFNINKKWYAKRLEFTIPIKLKYNIPNRAESDKVFHDNLSIDIMLEDSTSNVSQAYKNCYIKEFYKIPQNTDKPFLHFSDMKKSFDPQEGSDIFRSCLNYKPVGLITNLLEAITEYPIKFIIITCEYDAYLNINALSFIAKLCDVFIYHINIKEGKKFFSNNKPGFYKVIEDVEFFSNNKYIADNSIYVCIKKGGCEDLCTLSAEIVLNDIYRVKTFNFKYHLVFLPSYLNEWCLKRVKYESPVLVKYKKQGLDINDFFKAKTTNFSYFSGNLLVIPYETLGTAVFRMVVDRDNVKFKTYDLDDIRKKGYYYNLFTRSFSVFENKYINEKYGFDRCADCSLFAFVTEKLMNKLNIPNGERSDLCMKILFKIFGQTLKINSHGYLYDHNDDCILNAYRYELISKKIVRTNKIKI